MQIETIKRQMLKIPSIEDVSIVTPPRDDDNPILIVASPVQFVLLTKTLSNFASHINKLPYTPVIVNVEQDGSNNLILQNNNDGAVVINAATRSGTGGGLKIFNSGETNDRNDYR